MGRGCRQGDPISPYLFVLAVELMGEAFRSHPEMTGIIVHGQEHTISQFADDTTLFMKSTERNLRVCMNVLNSFFLISGLKINVEKTKAIKFGVTGDSRITLCEDLNLIWTQEFTSLGIDYNINSLDKITDLNLESRILEMEKMSSIWNVRNLTLIGKITIIKTLMISKIIHILLSLPKPSEEYFIRIENVFKRFLWHEKPPKCSFSILENLIPNGGLQFPNIRKIDITMKASWIKRLYKSNDGWAATPFHYGIHKIYEYGDVFLQGKNTIRNTFWRDVVNSIYNIYSNASIKGVEHLLSTPIWYNSTSISEKIQSWVDKVITTIGDLLDDNGEIVSIDHIQSIMHLNCNFLLFNRIRKKIQLIIGNSQIVESNNLTRRLPYILYIIDASTKGNKNTYFNSFPVIRNTMVNLQNKWSERLNDDIRIDTISNSFKTPKNTVHQYTNILFSTN